MITPDQIIERMPDLPETFGDQERETLESILAVLIIKKSVDEMVWHQAVRLAHHRATWDRLVGARDEEKDAKQSTSDFLSGKDQRIAFHENKIADLEKELLGTPYVRAKQLGNQQTDFLDRLAGNESVAASQSGTVTELKAYRPISGKLAK